MYKTKITSQGTITLPASLRKKYGFQAGTILSIEDTGKIIISKMPDIEEIRKKNERHLKKVGLWGKSISYKQGDGMAAHVLEKYGKNKK